MRRTRNPQDEHPYARLWRVHLVGPPESVWTPQRVAVLNPLDISNAATGFGVPPKALFFSVGDTSHRSAWRYAEEEWLPFARTDDPLDLDFLRLAACEMWRYSVSEPSQESLHDYYAAAEFAESHARPDEAFLNWSVLWRMVKGSLTPDIPTTADANALLLPCDDFKTFAQSFSSSAVEVTFRNRGTHEYEAIEEMLSRFPDEEPEWRATLACDLALVLIRCGRAAEGERVLGTTLEKYPNMGVGYLTLASVARDDDPPNLEKMRRAVTIVEGAVRTLSNEQVRAYDLRDLLDELKRELFEAQGITLVH